MKKMPLVVAYSVPFLAKEVGPELTGGVFTATDWWWTLEDKYPLSKLFLDTFEQKYNYKPDWSAEAGYMQLACWARMVSEAGTFYPPDVIKTYEKGEHFELAGGRRVVPPAGPPTGAAGDRPARQDTVRDEERG